VKGSMALPPEVPVPVPEGVVVEDDEDEAA
jgi:hypothetical protein